MLNYYIMKCNIICMINEGKLLYGNSKHEQLNMKYL